MGVESVHQRGTLDDDANARVAMTVDAPLMTLGQAKPTLQIEVVLDFCKRVRANEKTGAEAEHDLDHVLVNRLCRPLEALG